jgi:hypothetical protein
MNWKSLTQNLWIYSRRRHIHGCKISCILRLEILFLTRNHIPAQEGGRENCGLFRTRNRNHPWEKMELGGLHIH